MKSINKIPTNKKLENFINSTQKELESFFHIKMEPVDVFLIDSRKDIDRIWRKKTEKWLTAWTKNNNIFILNPKNYTRESDHKDIKHFWQTLKHECSHLYFKQLTQANYPKWLNEGLACYLANQVKKELTQKEALKVFDYYSKIDWQIYSIGYFWVKLLIEKFGRKKLLTLLKQLKPNLSEHKFKLIFYKLYKIKFSKKHLSILLMEI